MRCSRGNWLAILTTSRENECMWEHQAGNFRPSCQTNPAVPGKLPAISRLTCLNAIRSLSDEAATAERGAKFGNRVIENNADPRRRGDT